MLRAKMLNVGGNKAGGVAALLVGAMFISACQPHSAARRAVTRPMGPTERSTLGSSDVIEQGVVNSGAGASRSAEPEPSTRSQPTSTTASTPTPAPRQVMTRTERAGLREQALGMLVNTALAGSPEERTNAIEALTTTPARLAPILEQSVHDSNLAVRTVSCMAIGRSRLSALAPKARVLLQDPSPFVRGAAIFALKKTNTAVDPTPLADMLADQSPRVRAHSAYILGELGERSALGPLSDAAKAPISRANPGEQRLLDLQIAEARVKLGEDAALADIRTALFPARPEDLEAALLGMQIVGQVRDRASVNRLIQLTNEMDESRQTMPGEIRLAAAMALAKLGQPQGSYIATQYFAGERPALRAQSAHLFGEIGRSENLPILGRMMSDPDGRVRVAAAAAIVKITDRDG